MASSIASARPGVSRSELFELQDNALDNRACANTDRVEALYFLQCGLDFPGCDLLVVVDAASSSSSSIGQVTVVINAVDNGLADDCASRGVKSSISSCQSR